MSTRNYSQNNCAFNASVASSIYSSSNCGSIGNYIPNSGMTVYNVNIHYSNGNVTHPINDAVLYASPTIFFTSISAITTYFNIKKLHKYDKYRSNAFVGALLGASQTALGSAMAASNGNDMLSIGTGAINIASGLTVLTTSIIRLATKNPPKENKITFRFWYLPPLAQNNGAMGLCLSKRF
ncbi:MAG: hypothetical protein JSU07_11630 [Bacteroidetes bacterium]|nr:hypothetical protein [Bacteroidota bacterium]